MNCSLCLCHRIRKWSDGIREKGEFSFAESEGSLLTAFP
jgi:hypothetical protein